MLRPHQVDLHIPSPNFQGDMQFSKVILVKPDSVKFFLSLEIDPWGFVCTLETITSRDLEFLKICMLEDHVIEHTFSFGIVTQFHLI
jgi:hypothetical protein